MSDPSYLYESFDEFRRESQRAPTPPAFVWRVSSDGENNENESKASTTFSTMIVASTRKPPPNSRHQLRRAGGVVRWDSVPSLNSKVSGLTLASFSSNGDGEPEKDEPPFFNRQPPTCRNHRASAPPSTFGGRRGVMGQWKTSPELKYATSSLSTLDSLVLREEEEKQAAAEFEALAFKGLSYRKKCLQMEKTNLLRRFSHVSAYKGETCRSICSMLSAVNDEATVEEYDSDELSEAFSWLSSHPQDRLKRRATVQGPLSRERRKLPVNSKERPKHKRSFDPPAPLRYRLDPSHRSLSPSRTSTRVKTTEFPPLTVAHPTTIATATDKDSGKYDQSALSKCRKTRQDLLDSHHKQQRARDDQQPSLQERLRTTTHDDDRRQWLKPPPSHGNLRPRDDSTDLPALGRTLNRRKTFKPAPSQGNLQPLLAPIRASPGAQIVDNPEDAKSVEKELNEMLLCPETLRRQKEILEQIEKENELQKQLQCQQQRPMHYDDGIQPLPTVRASELGQTNVPVAVAMQQRLLEQYRPKVSSISPPSAAGVMSNSNHTGRRSFPGIQAIQEEQHTPRYVSHFDHHHLHGNQLNMYNEHELHLPSHRYLVSEAPDATPGTILRATPSKLCLVSSINRFTSNGSVASTTFSSSVVGTSLSSRSDHTRSTLSSMGSIMAGGLSSCRSVNSRSTHCGIDCRSEHTARSTSSKPHWTNDEDRIAVLSKTERVLIRGSQQTKEEIAAQVGSAKVVQCCLCQAWLQVGASAKLLYCGDCGGMTPLGNDGEANEDEERKDRRRGGWQTERE